MRFSTVIRPASRSPDRSAGGALRTISHPFAFHERHFWVAAPVFRIKHTKRGPSCTGCAALVESSQRVPNARKEFDRPQHIAVGERCVTAAGHAEEDVETELDVVG